MAFVVHGGVLTAADRERFCAGGYVVARGLFAAKGEGPTRRAGWPNWRGLAQPF